MKRTLLLLVLITLFACGGLASCGERADMATLYVCNWGEYISDGLRVRWTSTPPSRVLHETYGERVKVNYSTFPSNEALRQIEQRAANYDVIFLPIIWWNV